MKTFYTAEIELRRPVSNHFTTEPYQCGWADEAIIFLTVEENSADFDRLVVHPQISPDGIHWVDGPHPFPPIWTEGLYAACLTQFGGWLRLRANLEGRDHKAVISFRLTLKG